MISYFEYNGKKSDDFGIRLFNSLEFSPASKRISQIEVLGRDGVLLIDDNSYKPIEKTINFDVRITGTPTSSSDGSLIFQRALQISKWLNAPGFNDFKYSMYPGFLFKATVIDKYNLTDTIRKYGKGSIRVLFHPFMYYDSGLSERKLFSGGSIDNIGVPCKPLIKIIPKTSGATYVTINNNSQNWLKLINIDSETFVDSELMQVRDANGLANNKLVRIENYDYPILVEGENRFTFDSSLADIYIIPRFREVAI